MVGLLVAILSIVQYAFTRGAAPAGHQYYACHEFPREGTAQWCVCRLVPVREPRSGASCGRGNEVNVPVRRA